jgi:predicted XRE-type DNA-binding protein
MSILALQRIETQHCQVDGCGRQVWARSLCPKHYQRWRTRGSADDLRTENGAALRYLVAHVGFTGRECLPFPFRKDTRGYGIVRHEGRERTASRVMCILARGEPSFPNAEAAHSCGKGHEGCVNPQHLSWKTRQQNIDDAWRAGSFHRANRARGKLDAQQVEQIRQDARTQNEIAVAYGVSQSTISRIQTKQIWDSTKRSRTRGKI